MGMDPQNLSIRIRSIADASEIDALGFADASEFTDYAFSRSKRRCPILSLPDAKTIIVAGIYIGGLSLPAWSDGRYGRTSRLYLSGFFADVVKPLVPIVELLRANGYHAAICDSLESKTSILPLKLAAIRAGLGWQGKHSLLISRKYGSFLALGGIVTNALLDHNSAEKPDRCGTCRKCRDVCPLRALEQPYKLNRERCLSSLLQMEDFPQAAQTVSENRVGDCEICQDVCPWNKKHLVNPIKTELSKHFQNKIRTLEDLFYLPKLVQMTEAEYRKDIGHFKTGIPYEIFHRNVLLAMQNTKDL